VLIGPIDGLVIGCPYDGILDWKFCGIDCQLFVGAVEYCPYAVEGAYEGGILAEILD
jgi:hypothetical protein